ncbi:MAG: hypothetical protein IIA64_06265, partial [Planctomycetes bacterium]|nr:hypothetical protein [Planctomycetota bacterium]
MSAAHVSSTPNNRPPLAPTSGSRGRSWLRRLGLLLGAVLLVAAIIFIARQHDVLARAFSAIRQPSAPHLLLLIACVLGNVVLTALMFSVLMSRYGKVRLIEMQALIGAATLLNFLPLRPGLFGRIAYHKTVNDIPPVDTAKTIGQAIALSVGVAGCLTLCLVLAGQFHLTLWVVLALPFALLAFGTLVGSNRRWALAGLIRYVDVFVWAARYYAAFGLIDYPISIEAALAFACISMIATLVPFFSNVLGLR